MGTMVGIEFQVLGDILMATDWGHAPTPLVIPFIIIGCIIAGIKWLVEGRKNRT